MKNKKSIYVLLPLVLVIWFAVIYQFFSYSSPVEDFAATYTGAEIKSLKMKARDTSSIDVRYRDPFLGKIYTPADKQSAKVGRKKSPSAVSPILWPNVQFKGLVSDAKGKNPVFMLMLDGKTYLLKPGQSQNGVLLKKGDRNSVSLVYQKQQSTFYLKT